MERHGTPDYQPEQQAAVVVVVPERRNNDGARHLFLGAGRVLMLWGWGALTVASTSGRKNDDDDGGGGRPDTCSAVHALLAFVLWILGVSLVALVHVERRFPRAARVGAAAANAVVNCFFAPRPWN